MPDPLTPRQQEVLVFIRRYRLKNGMSPTNQEMAEAFGLSKTSIHEHCEQLVRKGHLQRTSEHTARNLEPLNEPTVLLGAAKQVVDEEFDVGDNDTVQERIQAGLDALPQL